MDVPHLVFFVDRSLGRHRVPNGLRTAGWSLITLAEHYGQPRDESVTDVEWLTLAGSQDWAVLMKDDRIRYRPAERRALMDAGVHAFCLANANLRAQAMVDVFLARQAQMFLACAGTGPSLHIVTTSSIRAVEL